jgi:hypothetical protein
VRVIDGDQHRPARRQVDHQPVQAVQHRERTTTSRLRADLAGQQWPRRGGRAGQQRRAFAVPRARQAPFEQLAHHTERETRLQLRAPGPHNLVAKLIRPRAGRLNQRRLADAGPALDQQHGVPVLQQPLDRRQVTLALTQPPHQASVPFLSRSVHRSRSCATKAARPIERSQERTGPRPVNPG